MYGLNGSRLGERRAPPPRCRLATSRSNSTSARVRSEPKDKREKDLSAGVQAKFRTELVRTEVRTESAQTERETVDQAAAAIVQWCGGQGLKKSRDCAAALLLAVTLSFLVSPPCCGNDRAARRVGVRVESAHEAPRAGETRDLR